MIKVVTCLIAIFTLIASASADTEKTQTGETTLPAPSLEKIADGVWIHKSYHHIEPWGPILSQGMVVNTGANLLLVDSAWNDEATREILRLIREETGKTPDAAIVTHAHDDKMGGMTALHEAGVQSFAFALTNEDAPDRNLVRAMNDFPQSMSGEVHAFTVDERQAHKTGLFWLHPGAGHTRDNIVVYYEPAKILFGGCLIRPGGSGSLGNTADGDVANWANAVRKVATEFPEAEIVIPTHGPKGARALLDHTISLAEQAIRAD